MSVDESALARFARELLIDAETTLARSSCGTEAISAFGSAVRAQAFLDLIPCHPDSGHLQERTFAARDRASRRLRVDISARVGGPVSRSFHEAPPVDCT